MCKVTIKKVEKFLKGASGESNGKPWELHVFKCLVSVDGSSESAVRTCKTFDAGIAQQIKDLKDGQEVMFEAKQEGGQKPFDFLLQPERKRQKPEFKGQRSAGETNRQAALRIAVELERGRAVQSGDVPTSEQIIGTAEKFLKWLEG